MTEIIAKWFPVGGITGLCSSRIGCPYLVKCVVKIFYCICSILTRLFITVSWLKNDIFYWNLFLIQGHRAVTVLLGMCESQIFEIKLRKKFPILIQTVIFESQISKIFWSLNFLEQWGLMPKKDQYHICLNGKPVSSPSSKGYRTVGHYEL
jgi:hypothetical protein